MDFDKAPKTVDELLLALDALGSPFHLPDGTLYFFDWVQTVSNLAGITIRTFRQKDIQQCAEIERLQQALPKVEEPLTQKQIGDAIRTAVNSDDWWRLS